MRVTATGSSFLVVPRQPPPLDASFRPAVLATRAFRQGVAQVVNRTSVRLALEQADGSVFHTALDVFPADHPASAANFAHVERTLKFLLWSRGGFRIYVDGPAPLSAALAAHYKDAATGRFDSQTIGEQIYGRPIEIVATRDIPAPRQRTTPLGRHLDGCRIGFDLGGSDRKVAAVIDGKVVFSEETTWDPYPQPDPDYHQQGIMDSLRKAAAHLPRVDAIGGSAAGVYVNNEVRVASLFRGVPPDVFERRVKRMFFEISKAWHDVPFEVVNDGEVTALAGSMSLGKPGVLGVALGTSTAGGYVTADGNITSWLNEFAFVPVDHDPTAPRDEWSGDCGVGAQYLSQQAVGRLIGPAGIVLDAAMPLPEKLVEVQRLMAAGDGRARKIYETLGVYLGYSVAHFADFYDFAHVLVLGRVTSGTGGDLMLAVARSVLETDCPDVGARTSFMVPDEKDKRHGQAIAAASLPMIAARA